MNNYHEVKAHLLRTLLDIDQQPECIGLDITQFAEANKYDIRTVGIAMNELELQGMTEAV